MNSINTAVLNNFQTATHSIIKDFVLAEGLNEDQRLARIAVIHSVIESPENPIAYIQHLHNILTDGNASAKLCGQAMAAARQLEVSHMHIVSSDNQLNEFGMQLIRAIAEAVTLITPESFLPMHNCSEAPSFSNFTTMNIEGTATVKTNLFKNGLQLSRKRAPTFFAGMDALWTQQYRLNQDIMELVNLPVDFENTRMRIGFSPAYAESFSFRYTADSRGRVYARGFLATPQGDGFSKAVLNLAHAKPLGTKGLNALAIHYANVAGNDKLSLEDRINWSRQDGMGLAIRMGEAEGDFVAIKELSGFSDDKDVFEMYAASQEWFRASVAPDSTKFESSLVCHQDATNSGFQFGAALMGDKDAAESTNLLASHYSQAPQDLYKRVARSMISHLDEAMITTWACVINRKSVKKVVMVTGYGAGKKTQLEAFVEGLEKIGANHLIDQADQLTDALSNALADNANALLQFTAAMKAHAKAIEGKIEWITEDGMLVRHDYQEMEAYGTGKYKVVATRFAGTDEGKNASALPPNFIHSIDGNMLRKGAVKAQQANIDFVPIHDSFGTHACDFFKLGRVLRESFIEVMRYDWYNNFCQFNDVEPKVRNRNEFDITDVRKSTYMFS